MYTRPGEWSAPIGRCDGLYTRPGGWHDPIGGRDGLYTRPGEWSAPIGGRGGLYSRPGEWSAPIGGRGRVVHQAWRMERSDWWTGRVVHQTWRMARSDWWTGRVVLQAWGMARSRDGLYARPFCRRPKLSRATCSSRSAAWSSPFECRHRNAYTDEAVSTADHLVPLPVFQHVSFPNRRPARQQQRYKQEEHEKANIYLAGEI